MDVNENVCTTYNHPFTKIKDEAEAKATEEFLNKYSLNGLTCGKPIISIVRADDKVLVMYNDCSYSIAPISVVAKEILSMQEMECINKRLKALHEENKDLLDKLKQLEGKPEKPDYDDSGLKKSVQDLGTKVNDLSNKIPEFKKLADGTGKVELGLIGIIKPETSVNNGGTDGHQ